MSIRPDTTIPVPPIIARLLATLFAFVLVVGVSELGSGSFAGLDDASHRQQLVAWLCLGSLYLLVMALLIRSRLTPILDYQRMLQQQSVPTSHQAHHDALRFPIYVATVGVGLATGLLAVKFIADLFLFDLQLSIAGGMLLRALSLSCSAAVLYYLLARLWLRQIISQIAAEEMPTGSHLSLRTQIAAATVATLAAMVPILTATAGQLQQDVQQHRKAGHQQLVNLLADAAEHLDADKLREICARLRPEAARFLLLDRPLPGAAAAALPAGLRARFINLVPSKGALIAEGTLDWIALSMVGLLALLSIGLALHLGGNLARDTQRLESRILALATPPARVDSDTALPTPMHRRAPQFTELRQLAHTVNALLERTTEINLAQYIAAEKTAEADRLRTQFLAHMSHDLRSPLNSVLGYCDLLLGGYDGPLNPDQRTAIDEILRSGQELLVLIDAVLATAKLAGGGMKLLLEDTPPAELLTRTLKVIGQRHLPTGVKVESHLRPGLPVLRLDVERLADALTNIVCFCADLTVNGAVSVGVSVQPPSGDDPRHFLQIIVRDTSSGVPAEQRPHLYEGMRQHAGRGLGLELHIARAIVELHDGTLSLTSNVGDGNCFVAAIPAMARVSQRLRPVKV